MPSTILVCFAAFFSSRCLLCLLLAWLMLVVSIPSWCMPLNTKTKLNTLKHIKGRGQTLYISNATEGTKIHLELKIGMDLTMPLSNSFAVCCAASRMGCT